MRAQTGFSLTEILIAGTLGILLIAGIIKLYIAYHKIYHLEMGLVRLQENVRIAKFFLETDLHSAGYIGCANIADIQIYPLSSDFMADTSLQGFTQHYIGSVSIPNHIKLAMREKTDAIYIQKMDSEIADMVNADRFQISRDLHINSGDNLIIADCAKAEIFAANQIIHRANAWYLIPKTPLQHHYSIGAQIGRWAKIVYFIAPANNLHGSINGKAYSLYRKDLNDQKNIATELIEGVEDMQILYGVDTTGQGMITKYLRSEDTINWAQVKSLRIALLLSSIDEVLEKPETYHFNEQYWQAYDRVMRREWIHYVTLYNR